MIRHVLVAVLLCAALPASASQYFKVIGASASVDKVGGGSPAISARAAPGVIGHDFHLLADGDSETFNFLRFSTTCIWCIRNEDYKVTAWLKFGPPSVSVEGSGSGSALVLGGFITKGNLKWHNVPKSFGLGSGYTATIDFKDVSGWMFSPHVTTKATVTLGASPVSLPAGVLMLGAALAGMGYIGNRRRQA